MAQDSPSKDRAGWMRQVALAVQLPLMLVAPVGVGAAMGYLLDRWLHTAPVLMIVLIIFGFAVGVRDTLKSVDKEEKKQ
jgi:ATP synthase protein I